MKKKRHPPDWPKVQWYLRRDGTTGFILTAVTFALGCELICQQTITEDEIDYVCITPGQIRHLTMMRIRDLFAKYIDRKAA